MIDEQNRREVLEWAERLGLENMRDQFQALDGIKAHGRFLLTLTTSVGGAAFAYAFGQWFSGSQMSPLPWGVLTLGTYLYGTGALLLINVLRTRAMPAVANAPKHLYQPLRSLQALQEAELTNLQERIDQATEINNDAAMWLNRLQAALLLSPMAFLIGYLVSRVLSGRHA